MAVDLVPADDAPALFVQILEDLPSFWGDRDARQLHHPVWLRQFSPGALVVRDGGRLLSYLLGVVTVHRCSDDRPRKIYNWKKPSEMFTELIDQKASTA